MQIEKVLSITDLETRLSFRDTVKMRGRDIHLADTPPSPHPETPVEVHRVMLKWEADESGNSGSQLQDAPAALCWELTQPKSVLQDLTIHIPVNGRLYVHASIAEWRNVKIRGVILFSPEIPLFFFAVMQFVHWCILRDGTRSQK